MKIDLKEMTEGSNLVGKLVWICDYRREDLGKKAIRHVRPQEVLVRSNSELPENKRVHYSNNHFVSLTKKGTPSSTVIPVFDTTGYRSFEGVALNIFDNQQECIEHYNKQADDIIKRLDIKIESAVESLKRDRQEVVDNKIFLG
jgi:hypothetical protein